MAFTSEEWTEYLANKNASDYLYYSPIFPNVFSCLYDVSTTFVQEIQKRSPHDGFGPWLQETWEMHYVASFISMTTVAEVIAVAVLLTLIRYALSTTVFENFPKIFKIPKEDAEKFPECAWRGIMYTILWAWSTYLCILGQDKYFFYPIKHWEKWTLGTSVPGSIYWLYVAQMAFYLHCIYAMIFMETVRRDFTVMMAHHFVTIALLAYSLAVRFHIIGLLVLFVQDIGDILLELSKAFVYFKVRNGEDCFWTEMAANVTFLTFTVQWIIFRLFYYPTKLLYSTAYVSMIMFPEGPFYLSFNVLLMLLYCMHIYWFTFIVKLLYKVATGGAVEDNRESEIEQKKKD